MKILITGFEPFGQSPVNPSQMLAKTLTVSSFPKTSLVTAVLPVDQAAAPLKLRALIGQHQPEAVLAFGLALGRAKISLERVAINLQDFRIPDNRGVTLKDQPIAPDGPAAYFSTLPLQSFHAALVSAGIPVEYSLSAGAYLCNLIFYSLMHTLAASFPGVMAGFIHLPALPEQAAELDKPVPSMNFAMMQSAAEILINELVAASNTIP